jgi:hypothetical protein
MYMQVFSVKRYPKKSVTIQREAQKLSLAREGVNLFPFERALNSYKNLSIKQHFSGVFSFC